MKNKKEFSKAHLLYLRKERNNQILIHIFRIGLLLLLLGVWELVTYMQWVDPFILSSPSRIWKTLVSLASDGSLFMHIGVTLFETLLGFVIAVVFGTLFALLLWWSEKLRNILEPYIVILNSLPKIALGPIIIIWLGTGFNSILFMTILVAIIVVIMNMLNGFLQTDKNKILLLQAMGASKLQILGKLVIPSAREAFISTLKVSVGMAWIGSIMGEYISSRAGLGYLIVYGGQVLNLNLVMTATVILCLLAGIMYGVVAIFEKFTSKTK